MVFPVEVLPREFDGKLLLALTACECGWQALLGDQRRIRKWAGSLPAGHSLIGEEAGSMGGRFHWAKVH
jgi:hypothetical protein